MLANASSDEGAMGYIRNRLTQHFLLRWLLVNLLAWPLLLYVMTITVRQDWLFYGTGFVLVLLLGLAQGWAVYQRIAVGWIILTVIGLGGGLVIAFVVAPLVSDLHFRLEYVVAGLLVGCWIGLMQWLDARRHLRGFLRWWLAYGLGGAACGVISLPLTLSGALVGSLAFGLLTGLTITGLLREAN
jgi:hypothetical protein